MNYYIGSSVNILSKFLEKRDGFLINTLKYQDIGIS